MPIKPERAEDWRGAMRDRGEIRGDLVAPTREFDEIEASLGTIEDEGHAWDADAAGWVQGERRQDTRRIG